MLSTEAIPRSASVSRLQHLGSYSPREASYFRRTKASNYVNVSKICTPEHTGSRSVMGIITAALCISENVLVMFSLLLESTNLGREIGDWLRMWCGTTETSIRYPSANSVCSSLQRVYTIRATSHYCARLQLFTQRVEKSQWLIAQIIREHLLK